MVEITILQRFQALHYSFLPIILPPESPLYLVLPVRLLPKRKKSEERLLFRSSECTCVELGARRIESIIEHRFEIIRALRRVSPVDFFARIINEVL